MSNHPMRWLISLCEAQAIAPAHAALFIRTIEGMVQASNKHAVLHGMEPSSMTELGANRVAMEPLPFDHPRLLNLWLGVMTRLLDRWGVTLEIENVQDPNVYEKHGFVSNSRPKISNNTMVRRPKPRQPSSAPSDQ